MAEIIDLTLSPQRPDIIEISDGDQESTPPDRHSPTQENKKRSRKKRKTRNSSLATRPGGDSDQPLRTRSSQAGNEHASLVNDVTLHLGPSDPLVQVSSSTADEPEFFIIDGSAAPVVVEDDTSPSPEPVESNEDGNKLLLPSHVAILHEDGLEVPTDVIPPPKPSSDSDEEYIEYLDYEDRKAPGLVRYFEVEGEDSNQSKPSIFKCKKCGAEGEHKTYECPIQICLTCGARDEHSTRSCPISKTCFNCGMKGHINKTCPNRFSAHTMASSDLYGDCERCGSTEHNINECPTLWRIYQYVNDEEHIMILQSREERKGLAVGEGGEGYIGEEVWCYNCASVGHLGDDCDELLHPANSLVEYSAFSFHNVMSGPFYDPVAEPISTKGMSRERKGAVGWPHLPDNWDADTPVDVGKRGRKKDKEKLEKRFREQEDEGEDWFNGARNAKRRGMDQQTRPPGSRGKPIKFGSFKDGGHGRSSPPPSLPIGGNGPSLLARLGDPLGGKGRGKRDHGRDCHELSQQSDNSIRIRGAARDSRNQDGKYATSRKTDSERVQDQRDGPGDRSGQRGSRRGQGPRYKGGYDR